jgi:hypothetical protein
MQNTVQSRKQLDFILDSQKEYSAKTVVPINILREIRRWLVGNCGRRWKATDYNGNEFNWRKLGKLEIVEDEYLDGQDLDITCIVTFKNREDLLLYMLTWPSELLLYN